MRINARLDEVHRDRLLYLTRATHATVTGVLKEAIDLYYEQQKKLKAKPSQALFECGFVGVAEGDPDLSENYKATLGDSLAAKHDHR